MPTPGRLNRAEEEYGSEYKTKYFEGQGRYSRAEALQSSDEEYKKKQEEILAETAKIKKQLEDQIKAQEQTVVQQTKRYEQLPKRDAEEASFFARPQFEQKLTDLGISKEQQQFFQGVDQDTLDRLHSLRTSGSTPLYTPKGTGDTLKMLFKDPVPVRKPFYKPEEENANARVPGAILGIGSQVLFDLLELPFRFGAVTVESVKEAGGPDLGINRAIPDGWKFNIRPQDVERGFTEYGVDAKEKDKFVGLFKSFESNLDKQDEAHPGQGMRNGYRALWETFVPWVFDASVVADVATLGARAIAAKGIQHTIKRAGLAQDFKNIGAEDVFAKAGTVLDKQFKKDILDATLRKGEDILNGVGTEGVVGTTRAERLKNLTTQFDELVKAGALTPEQALQVQLMQNSLKRIAEMTGDTALKTASDALTRTQQIAIAMSTPVKNMDEVKTLIGDVQKLGKPGGPKMGLAIEDVAETAKQWEARSREFMDMASKQGKFDNSLFSLSPIQRRIKLKASAFAGNDAAKNAVIASAKAANLSVDLVDEAGKTTNLTERQTLEGRTQEFFQSKYADELARVQDEQVGAQTDLGIPAGVSVAIDNTLGAPGSSSLLSQGTLEDIQATGKLSADTLKKLLREQEGIRAALSIPKGAVAKPSNTLELAIKEQNAIIKGMAEQARATKPSVFADTYAFLLGQTPTRALSASDAVVPANAGNVADILNISGIKTVLSEDVSNLSFPAEFPLSLVDLPSAELVRLMRDSGMFKDQLARGTLNNSLFIGMDSAERAEAASTAVFDFDALETLINTYSGASQQELMQMLRANSDKPSATIVIGPNGRGMFVGEGIENARILAAIKLAGYDTIPAVVVDPGNVLAEFSRFMQQDGAPRSLTEFAQQSQKIAPMPKKGEADLELQFMRDEAMLASKRGVQVGPGQFSDRVVIPKNLIRTNLKKGTNWTDSGMLFEERFVSGKLGAPKKGHDRWVYPLSDTATVKVANTPTGHLQNMAALNYKGGGKGLVPKVYEVGKDGQYIVVETVLSMDRKQKEWFDLMAHEMRDFRADLVSVLPDGNIANDMNDGQLFIKHLIENTDIPQMTAPNGKELFDFAEAGRYRIALFDFTREANWGRRADGTYVMLDEGTLDENVIQLVAFSDGMNLEGKKFYEVFKKHVAETKDLRKKFGTTPRDGQLHGFFPVVGEDDEGNYEFDPFMSMWAMAFGAFARGKGKLPNKKSGKPVTAPYSHKVPEYLPNPKAVTALPSALVGKAILNSDAFAAETGQPFGGIFKHGELTEKQMGAVVLDDEAVILPLGDGIYLPLDADVASAYGPTVHVEATAENPLLIKSDDDLSKLLTKAGITDKEIVTGWKVTTTANAANLRKYIQDSGHDSVIIRMNDADGPSDMLRRAFVHDQLIMLDKSAVKEVADSAPRIARFKNTKLQNKILRLVEPLANRVEVNTAKALRQRLFQMNKDIKLGKSLGWQEAKVSVGNRLRNTFDFKINAIKRTHELEVLKARIISREKDLIKKELKDYVKGRIPPAHRSKFMDAILKANTRNELAKQYARIDLWSDKIRKVEIVKDIKASVDRILAAAPGEETGSGIYADYRKAVRELMSNFELDGHRASTIRRLKETQTYIDKMKREGIEIEMPEWVQEDLKILGRKTRDEMSVNELEVLLQRVELLEQLGRTKTRGAKARFDLRREKLLEQIVPDVANLDKAVSERVPEMLQERYAALQEAGIRTGKGLLPIDTLMEVLSKSGDGQYNSALYKNMKVPVDMAYSNYSGEYLKARDEVFNLVDDLGLKEDNFNRIGTYAVLQQKDGAERLIKMGFKKEELKSITLTDDEMKLYTYMREKFDTLKPRLMAMAARLFNIEFKEVDNFFPWLTDFEKHAETEMFMRFGEHVETMLDSAMTRKNVKHGTVKGRLQGAVRPLKLNALDVFIRHTDTAYYMLNMGDELKLLSSAVDTPEFKKASGKRTHALLSSWISLMVRKGGVTGANHPILDLLRRNTAVGQLAFKLSTILMQPGAFFPAVGEIGHWAFKGMNGMITKPEVRAYIKENFHEIRERYGDALDYLESEEKSLFPKTVRAGWSGIRFADGVTASSVAWGAYLKRMDQLGIPVDLTVKPDAEALAYAQHVVAITQSSSLFKDAPLALSAGVGTFENRSLNRAFFQFQSYVITNWAQISKNGVQYGLTGKALTNKYVGARILFWNMMGIVYENLALAGTLGLFAYTVGSQPNETWEEQSWIDRMMMSLTSRVPFVSQAMGIANFGSSPIPLVATAEKTVQGAAGVVSSKTDDAKARSVFRFGAGIGGLLGIPGSAQVSQIGVGLYRDGGALSESGTAGSTAQTLPQRPVKAQRPKRPER